MMMTTFFNTATKSKVHMAGTAVCVGIIVILGYVVYSRFFAVKTGFNANREHGKAENVKQADLLFFTQTGVLTARWPSLSGMH